MSDLREQVRDIVADVANPDGQSVDAAADRILALLPAAPTWPEPSVMAIATVLRHSFNWDGEIILEDVVRAVLSCRHAAPTVKGYSPTTVESSPRTVGSVEEWGDFTNESMPRYITDRDGDVWQWAEDSDGLWHYFSPFIGRANPRGIDLPATVLTPATAPTVTKEQVEVMAKMLAGWNQVIGDEDENWNVEFTEEMRENTREFVREMLRATFAEGDASRDVGAEEAWRVEAAVTNLSIEALARAWMDHLGYTAEQVAEAAQWQSPPLSDEPEDYDGPPEIVRDLDLACEYAREMVDPRVDALLEAAGILVDRAASAKGEGK